MKHGGLHQYDLLKKSDYLDLSVNLNPYGPRLNLALNQEELSTYPDPHCHELRRVIAKERKADVESILVGNGASELIWAAARAFLKAGDLVLVVKPSFSEFQTAALRLAAQLLEFETLEGEDFAINPEKLDAALFDHKPKIFSLCNPNSPSGSFLKPEVINCLASRHPETLFLLDESFLSLSVHHAAQSADFRSNVIRIVSLTKDHAIAGIRLGYALAQRDLIKEMKAEIPTWSVNALAQKIGAKLFEDQSFLDRSREFIFRDKIFVESSFQERSIHYIGGTSVFCMFQSQIPGLKDRLLEDHKILIRSCESYGLKNWYRIAVRSRIEMLRFFDALDQIQKRNDQI